MKPPTGKRVLMLLENCAFQFDKRVKNEALELLEAGYQVSVICPQPANGKQAEVVEGVRLYQFPPLPTPPGFLGYLVEYGYSAIVMSMLSLLVWVRKGFDILHAHNPPDVFFLLGAFYRLLGKRFVFDHHDLAPELYQARYRNRGNRLVYEVLKLMEILSCRVADHVLTTSESYATIERHRGNIPVERITLVRNGPLQESLQSVKPDPNLRQRAGTILCYIGVMGPQDGVDYLLRALHHIINDLGRTDFLCVLMGSGDALPGLKLLAAQLGIADHVLFTGWMASSDVARYLSATDICVTPDPSNPYNDRSTMIKNMEYMAMGKPIVAFDLPEHRVTADGAALYAYPNDELDFAKKIVTLIDDPEKREEMGRIGRKRIATELAWPYQAKRLLEAYAVLNSAGPDKARSPQ